MLEIVERSGTRVTCFVLGWIAQRFPHLVLEAHAAGHEIASHGFAHELVYQQSRTQFRHDIEKAKQILEDLIGEPVLGYRAPGFSVTEKTPWFFEELAAAGYRHDSSVFPAARGHGGMEFDEWGPCIIKTSAGPIVECPITVARVFGRRACFFGGGYFRLSPLWLIRRMSRQVLEEGRPVCVYLHPREIDPTHPRLPMSLLRRFKSYINLRSTERKLEHMLSEFSASTHRDYLAELLREASQAQSRIAA